MARRDGSDPAEGRSFDAVSLDAVQQYWDRRPCNVMASPAEIGTRSYFDEVEARKYFVEPHIPRFAEFDRWAGKRVLEIGCGIGTDTMRFAAAGAQVTAVDLSEASLELGRKRATIYGHDVDFRWANAEVLSATVPIEPYDLVYSFGVIHHTPHPERAVAEMRKFVKPGGTLKIMIYNKLSWKVFSILLAQGKGAFWRLNRLVAEHSEAQLGCPVTYTYTPAQARTLLAGFEITDVQIDHIFPYRVKEYTEFRYRKSLPFSVIPGPLFRWLERRAGWHLCVTAKAPLAV